MPKSSIPSRHWRRSTTNRQPSSGRKSSSRRSPDERSGRSEVTCAATPRMDMPGTLDGVSAAGACSIQTSTALPAGGGIRKGRSFDGPWKFIQVEVGLRIDAGVDLFDFPDRLSQIRGPSRETPFSRESKSPPDCVIRTYRFQNQQDGRIGI